MGLPQPLPDNPLKWDGWRAYQSENLYERLGLSFDLNPSSQQIEENCRQLLVWWQKKLPLKNQPSNPMTQLLRTGLDEAPKFLAEARALLLHPPSRARTDEKIRARLKQDAVSEFFKFLSFALANHSLSEEDETNLYRLGHAAGLHAEEMRVMVDAELVKRGARRDPKWVPPIIPKESAGVANLQATAPAKLAPGAASSDPKAEFARLLRLTGLSEDDLTDDQRDALCNMGENLGLTGGQAEDLIDEYLEAVATLPPISVAVASRPAAKPRIVSPEKNELAIATTTSGRRECVVHSSPLARAQERHDFPNFTNTIGCEMQLVTSGSFQMGSTAPDAAPVEQPVSQTHVSSFYLARFPITNQQYELFDLAHRTKRLACADDLHPVVYVSSLDAVRFCQWLSTRENKKYRLPTEAEWEYAARGAEGRIFPWGEKLNSGELANFADANTSFAWRDPEIDDGFAETAPVGSFPRGASPFGIEDMAGNVWEWCLDFFENYKGRERTNPHSTARQGRRIYRGGSWKSRASSLRTSARNFNVPEYLANDVGFRIVCECET